MVVLAEVCCVGVGCLEESSWCRVQGAHVGLNMV